MQELAKRHDSVCMIGVTGHGKSTTANTLIGYEYFKSSPDIKSETSEVRGVLGNWFGEQSQRSLMITDTPGLGDSESRDTEHITQMVQGLKTIGYVHCFLIVINSEDPRFNE